MMDTATGKIITFNMKILTSDKQPYELEFQLNHRGDACTATYAIMVDSVNGMIFYVGDRNLMPGVASAVMSQSNVNDKGTLTVTIDPVTGRRVLSIQDATNTVFGRDVLELTEARYNARYSKEAEPASYAAR